MERSANVRAGKQRVFPVPSLEREKDKNFPMAHVVITPLCVVLLICTAGCLVHFGALHLSNDLRLRRLNTGVRCCVLCTGLLLYLVHAVSLTLFVQNSSTVLNLARSSAISLM